MNTPTPLDPTELSSTLGLIETIQDLRLRTGGPSSSHLLNELASRAKRDLSRLAIDVTDSADQLRIYALLLGGMNAGLSKMYSTLSTQLTNVSGYNTSGQHKGVADFYLSQLVIASPSMTSCDINPLFGQAILPAQTRQNCLVIDRGVGEPPAIPSDAQLLISIQPSVITTVGATPPADYTFGEDPYSVLALDNDDRTFWPIEDSTTTGHIAWLEIRLPGNVSGAYRCNELEVIPFPAFASSLVSVQAEIVGQGWQDLDFSYLCGYDPVTRTVPALGPMRLCFSLISITRFRLGLWVAGYWGFSSIRVLSATYQPSANVTVDFTPYSPTVFKSVSVLGKNPQQLAYLSTSVNNTQVTVNLAPAAAASETPIISGIEVTW